ncbi:hypothetical protein D3C73_1411020 [compost metagenome]
MRFGAYPEFAGFSGNQLTQGRVAFVFVGHVADEVRQFVAGIQPFEMRAAIDVIGAVHQPVGIEHNNGVDAHFTAARADLFMTVDRRLAATMVFSRHFRQIH